MSEKKRNKMTLCWDCAKATGGCSWSAHLKPVKGSKGKLVVKSLYGQPNYKTVRVDECPEFERDAYRGGLIRIRKEDKNDSMSKDS